MGVRAWAAACLLAAGLWAAPAEAAIIYVTAEDVIVSDQPVTITFDPFDLKLGDIAVIQFNIINHTSREGALGLYIAGYPDADIPSWARIYPWWAWLRYGIGTAPANITVSFDTAQPPGYPHPDYDGSYHLLSFVGGPTPAPEPATWAMMLAGLGGLAMIGRRRRLRAGALRPQPIR